MARDGHGDLLPIFQTVHGIYFPTGDSVLVYYIVMNMVSFLLFPMSMGRKLLKL